MGIRYDPDVDAMYVYIRGTPGEEVDHTQGLEDGFAVDFRADGSVCGIEILDASQRLGFPRGCPEVSLEQVAFRAAPAREGPDACSGALPVSR